MRALLVLVAVGLSAGAQSEVAWAQSDDGFRCGVRLLEPGLPALEVERRCSAPSSRTAWEEWRGERTRRVLRSVNGAPPRLPTFDRWVRVQVEEWLYPGSYGSFPRLLRMENGRLVSVTALSR